MRFEEIQRIAARGESETVEFKETTGELRQAMESVCAFLNTHGGRVLFGITPAGRIIGQQVSDRTQQELANAVRKLELPIPIDIAYFDVPDTERQVIVFSVPPATEMIPFVYDGRPYERIGTTSPLMSQERYQQSLLQRLHSRMRWENSPALENDLTFLDEEAILRTVRLGVQVGRLPEATGSDVGDILQRLGLRIHGQLLNAAFVLFGKSFLPHYPQCQLRMARFKGLSKTEFLDDRQVYGHGFALLDEALLFLQRHLPVAGRIQAGTSERVDTPSFPLIALREALVNALCHRDYSQAGGAVSLAIYDDRLEIWSAGTLPFGLQVDDLKRDHPSRPRNPIIADVFYKAGLVERWGRGTQRIVELCVASGQPEPEFIEIAGEVGVRFYPDTRLATLTTRQNAILQLITAYQPIPLRAIMQRLDDPPSSASIQLDLTRLRNMGLITLVGRGRSATWQWTSNSRSDMPTQE